MIKFVSQLLLLLAACVATAQQNTYCNDTVYLKSGQVLTGSVSEGEATKGGEFILLTTSSGSVYKLDKGDIVRTIVPRDQVDIQYKKRLALVRDIATDHIELVKWCEDQEKGSTRFAEQIRWHYENVIRLDPNHQTARKNLGHMELADGTWVIISDYKPRHGYVKDRRHWISKLGTLVIANNERFDSENGSKRKAFNSWLKKVQKGTASVGELESICDASTIEMVYLSAMKNSNNVELCRVMLDAISKVESFLTEQYLARFAYEAPQQAIREHAISLLSQPHMNHTLAVDRIAQGLTGPDRWYVRSAAIAIAEIASQNEESAIAIALPLINSLNTEHTEKLNGALAPGRMNPTFGSGGTGLRMGGGPQTKQVIYKNQSSLDALRRLFEADFQFSEERWKQWYIANYTLSDLQVRSDD